MNAGKQPVNDKIALTAANPTRGDMSQKYKTPANPQTPPDTGRSRAACRAGRLARVRPGT